MMVITLIKFNIAIIYLNEIEIVLILSSVEMNLVINQK